MTSSSTPTPTLLSALQPFAADEALQPASPSASLHPFSSSLATADALHSLLSSTAEVANALSTHLSNAPVDTKLVSQLRQLTSIANNLHQAETNTSTLVRALRARANTQYGEDPPEDPHAFLARLEDLGQRAGMHSFRDEHGTVTLAGKVLVIDIATCDLQVTGVKTSFAPHATAGPHALDACLLRTIAGYARALQANEPTRAQRMARRAEKQFRELMTLDGLAADDSGETDEAGSKWFTALDDLGAQLSLWAKREASTAHTALGLPSSKRTPLDVFLCCAHGLPLPTLHAPALSFLVYVSPKDYLALLRWSELHANSGSPALDERSPAVDISSAVLNEYLSDRHQNNLSATVAILQLSPSSTTMQTLARTDEDVEMGLTQRDTTLKSPSSTRPSFNLAAGSEGEARILASTVLAQPRPPAPPGRGLVWTLIFSPGTIVTQSRMRAIARATGIVMDAGEMERAMGVSSGLAYVGSYAGRGWIDMLLNPQRPHVWTEHYNATYRSPSNLHPPLKLRLTAPDEPGFVLERVEVRNVKEIWAVLEIVREQCWLNSALLSMPWQPEGVPIPSNSLSTGAETDDIAVTEAELEAVLAGTNVPVSLPVAVSLALPSGSGGGPAPNNASSASLTLTFPARAPMPGRVSISVAHDPSRPRGVRVALGVGMGLAGRGGSSGEEELEEVCRRGGVFGVAGRVWAASGGM